MSIWAGWREQMATRAVVRDWRAQGDLGDEAWLAAYRPLGPRPTLPLWRGFVEHLSLWLAVALLAAGIICFIAANWQQLGRMARLYGMQAVLVSAAVVAWRLRLARVGGQAALMLAAILLGGLLALVGQTYQTGADTWQLFAAWAALLLPWLIAAQSTAMTVLWLVVAQLALLLWLAEHRVDERLVFTLLGVINLLVYALWHQYGRHIAGLQGRLGPWLAALACLSWLVVAALADIFGWSRSTGLGLVAWLVATVVIAATAWRKIPRDLLLLSLAALSVIVVDTCLLGRVLFEAAGVEAFAFLLLTVAVVGQTGWFAAWLRGLVRAQPHEAELEPGHD